MAMLTVKIADLPGFKAFCDHVQRRLTTVEAERDEWRARYLAVMRDLVDSPN